MLKLAVLTFLIGYAYAGFYEESAKYWIPKINAKERWQAGYNPYLAGKSLEDIKRLMGTKLDSPKPKAPMKDFRLAKGSKAAPLPTTFTAGLSNWTKCQSTIAYIKDQADCGSCWAVAASEVIADRICIGNYKNLPPTKGKLNENRPLIDMSAEQILSCCSFCGDGCQGGYIDKAMGFWAWMGVVTGGWYGSNCGCQSYSIQPCPPSGCSGPEPPTPACRSTCDAGYANTYANDKHFASSYYTLPDSSTYLQQEIYTNGPIECGYSVYENFMHYTGGVYDHTEGQRLGGHAVKIIGWGVENGEDYWLINNSWNITWGIKGQFKYLRGTDLGGMESQCAAGIAKIEQGTGFLLQCNQQ
jgi:cathepsin B